MKTQKQKSGSAGRVGPNVKSDCFVQLINTSSGGITIELKSKVESLYGDSIRSQISEILKHFGTKNATIKIEDQGAVPFVIAARVESALKRAGLGTDKVFLIGNTKSTKINLRDRTRRTRLYLPGNEPHFFLNAGLHKPDSIILDLEDSVAPSEKDAARILVRNALMNVNFGEAERMVRINPFPLGIDDLQQTVQYNVQTILIPKCESSARIEEVDSEIDKILKLHNIKRNIFLIPIIETALGVVKAFEIASASKWNCGLAIGLEDYTADIGVERTKAGTESLFARSTVINAAKAAGIQALDSVFSDVNDEEGLHQSVLEAKAIGFEGKGCIHPRQIKVIHEAFAPTQKEVEYAQRVVDAFNEAKQNGSGVISLGSKMIDAPVVKRAQHILSLVKLNSDK
ncbi:MAG: aldolase/citrate lyase family protein [Bacteroidota bacterium]|nr:aldolase/citrate lyase family protein [Bacteroidota bacterium]